MHFCSMYGAHENLYEFRVTDDTKVDNSFVCKVVQNVDLSV